MSSCFKHKAAHASYKDFNTQTYLILHDKVMHFKSGPLFLQVVFCGVQTETLNTDINSVKRDKSEASAVWLQQQVLVSLLALAMQRRPGGHLEHLPHAVLAFGGAVHVSEGTDAVGHVAALFRLHRLLRDRRRGVTKAQLHYRSSFAFQGKKAKRHQASLRCLSRN